jgi:hypothetical protein
MRLPVLHKNLHEPPQSMPLDDVKRAPGEEGCFRLSV